MIANTGSNDERAEIPDHVPAAMRCPFNFYTSPGLTPTPFGDPQAVTSVLHNGPPIFYSAANSKVGEGVWVVVGAADQRRVLQDTETFTSYRKIFSGAIGEDWPLIPLEIDPPEHARYRSLLNPLLSPSRVVAMEPVVRERAATLIEGIKSRGSSSDVMNDFAFPFAVSVFLQFLGLPLDRLMEFVGWGQELTQGTAEQRAGAVHKVIAFITDLAVQRRRQRGDDFMSFVVNARIDGRPLTDEEIRAMGCLLFGAGLDTVAAAIGFDLYHLARHPEDQKLLRDNPGKIQRASEELLRAYATVTPIRVATRDVDLLGAPVKKGDLISCPTMVANRDPLEFPDPDRIDLDREVNRHTAFAYGPHRCLGSHLARREIVIGLEEWLSRIPQFEIRHNTAPLTSGGYVFAVKNLILDWQR
jgi:cytochrome P450